MWPTALRPRPPKFSVNAPGSAGFSLVTIESGRADWADAAAANPMSAAQADIVKRPVRAAVERFFPFGLMIMGPILAVSCGVLWMVSAAVRPPACRARRGRDSNRMCRRADQPDASLE